MIVLKNCLKLLEPRSFLSVFFYQNLGAFTCVCDCAIPHMEDDFP